MTEFRLGWFCYILQKSEKKKRNQEDFVNSILNRLVSENNPKISFIPEILPGQFLLRYSAFYLLVLVFRTNPKEIQQQ